jgi:hypothetical protein
MSKIRPIPQLIRVLYLLFVAAGIAVAGSSLDLPAPTDYAFTADSPTFDFDGSFTIDVRFLTYSAHNGCLIAKFHQSSGSASDDSYYILVRSDGGLEARIQTMTSLITLTTEGNVHDSQWHHAALVYDIDAEIAELYLDGVLGDSGPLSDPLRDTAESVRLGALRTTGSLADFYNGRMDELRIWNTARRGEQVNCLNNVTLLLDTPGLVSYYRFDEGAGATAYDLVAPYENFTFISGAGFNSNEPVFLSLLNGPGACFCGEVSGLFTELDPTIMLVGDTITVPAGDSLVLSSCTMIFDSTVSRFNVYGKLNVAGDATDSSYILGQYMNSSDAVIHLLAPDSVTTSLSYTRVSGLASRPFIVNSPISVVHSVFADNPGGALLLHSNAELDSSAFANSDSVSILAESGVIDIEYCSFSGNNGALAISESCSVAVKQSIFNHNVKSGGDGGAIYGHGSFDGTSGSYLALRDCQFTDNSALNGGAVWCEDMNLQVESSQFTGNSSEASGGAIGAVASAGQVCRVVIDSTDFTSNSGANGAAIHLLGIPGAGPVEFSLTHAVLAENAGANGAFYGSGVAEIAGYEALMERVCFYDNTDAITLLNPYNASTIELRNLTVVGNAGTAVFSDQPAIVRNCIITDNSGSNQFAGSAALSVFYCITSDEEYLGGPNGNFDGDPLFFDYLNRDLRLTAGSPAINRGDPNMLFLDTDGTRADIGAFAAQDFSPVIQSVLDVPADNGKHVMIQWLPSPGDDQRAGIASYQIYREVNLPLDENYELLAEIPAGQLPGYGQIVTTIADSNAHGHPYFTYFVRAESVNPLAFWDSETDSGFSIDNLAPQTPELLAQLVLNQIDLSWSAAPDSDLAFYELYRETSSFDPDTVAAYITTSDTFFTDENLADDGYAYRVRAVDYNGNYSGPSNEEWIDLQTLEAPRNLTVYPMSGFLVLRWLPVTGAARYHLYRANSPDEQGELFGTTVDQIYFTPINNDSKVYWVVAEP